MTNNWGYEPKTTNLKNLPPLDAVCKISISIDANSMMDLDINIKPGYEDVAALLLVDMMTGVISTQLIKQIVATNKESGIKLQQSLKKYLQEFKMQSGNEPLIKPTEVFARK